MAEKNAIVKRDSEPQSKLIQLAIEKGANIETIEKMLNLQIRWEDRQAEKLYNKAMANFQGDCPVIRKKTEGGKTNSGQVAYKYATLGDIVSQVRELLQENGLSYAIKTEFPDANSIKVVCISKHSAGHQEQTEVIFPLTTKTGIMSNTQQVAATVTFAKRYAFCNAFGIMTGEDDNEQILTPAEIDEAIKNTLAMIGAMKNKATLLETLKKVQTSKKGYTPEQKAIVEQAISNRLDLLDNQK